MSAPHDYKVEIDAPNADVQCECGDSCGWHGVFSGLAEIGDCSLTPGDASPAGRCPDCDALAYVVKAEGEAAPVTSISLQWTWTATMSALIAVLEDGTPVGKRQAKDQLMDLARKLDANGAATSPAASDVAG
jgi:hypothetical protein